MKALATVGLWVTTIGYFALAGIMVSIVLVMIGIDQAIRWVREIRTTLKGYR